MANVRKSRGSEPEHARTYRQHGHYIAKLFAIAIGVKTDYENNPKAKKDVVDKSGDTHSVKSGNRKWQVFLYGLKRFKEDTAFLTMNGTGQIIAECINTFPENRTDYIKNKQYYKEKLRPHMVALADKLKNKNLLNTFIEKSMFEGGQVDYLTIYHEDKFHVFWGKEIKELMSKLLEVENSKAIKATDTPEQKVVLKYKSKNLGSIEMRNDSEQHYREVKFELIPKKTKEFLFENILKKEIFKQNIIVYGEAIKRFGRW